MGRTTKVFDECIKRAVFQIQQEEDDRFLIAYMEFEDLPERLKEKATKEILDE